MAFQFDASFSHQALARPGSVEGGRDATPGILDPLSDAQDLVDVHAPFYSLAREKTAIRDRTNCGLQRVFRRIRHYRALGARLAEVFAYEKRNTEEMRYG